MKGFSNINSAIRANPIIAEQKIRNNEIPTLAEAKRVLITRSYYKNKGSATLIARELDITPTTVRRVVKLLPLNRRVKCG